MSGKTATIIGATGLIGSELLKLMEKDDEFSSIRLLVRRPFTGERERAEVRLIDFNDHESFKLGIDGSHTVFCAVGTTQKKVKGDKEAYRRVDYDIPVKAAGFCKETGCRNFLLVSSVGANSKSNNFYLRLKGEVEDSIKQMGLPSISIFRPSMLLGSRNESRPGEKLGQVVMKALSFAMAGRMKKYRPVEGREVAAAMLEASKNERPGFTVYEYPEIKRLAALVLK